MNKVIRQIFFVPLFMLAILLYYFIQPFEALYLKYGLTVLSIAIFSILFSTDYQRIFEKPGKLKYNSIKIHFFLGIISGVVFSSIILLPVYLTTESSAASTGSIGAVIFGAIGYRAALARTLPASTDICIFDRMKCAVGGAVIGGTIGASAYFTSSLFS
tara:strand:- start:243 stop:719 length:477 start_codon:yes stop_codon:yes gene_type:complete